MTDREAVDFLKKARLHLCVPRKNGKQITMELYIEAMTKAINALEEKTKALPIPMSRPHGEWIEKDYGVGKCWATCSECGESTNGEAQDHGFGYDYSFPNFCPNCGADMRKEGDEE